MHLITTLSLNIQVKHIKSYKKARDFPRAEIISMILLYQTGASP